MLLWFLLLLLLLLLLQYLKHMYQLYVVPEGMNSVSFPHLKQEELFVPREKLLQTRLHLLQ